MPSLREALGVAALAAGLVTGAHVLPAQAAVLDAAVARFLGADIADVIATADRVESFQLEAKTDIVDPAVQGYAVREKGPELTLDQVETFRTLIFAESSYVFDKSKRCPFLADTGFVFHAGERQASVVLSQSCKMWGFAGGAERPRLEDYDPAEGGIKALLVELFEKP